MFVAQVGSTLFAATAFVAQVDSTLAAVFVRRRSIMLGGEFDGRNVSSANNAAIVDSNVGEYSRACAQIGE